MGSKAAARPPARKASKPIRVEMVIQQFHPIVGGAERQAQRLGNALVQRGLPVTLTTARWVRSWPGRDIVDGINVRRLNILRAGTGDDRTGAGLSFMVQLFWDLVRRSKTRDILHIHQALKPAVAAVAAGIMTKTPTIIKIGCGGDWNDITLLRKVRVGPFPVGNWMVRVLRRCTRMVALNASIARDLIAEGFRPDQVCEIPNGVVILEPKKHARVPAATLHLLFVGRLDPQKGLDTLLDALAHVPRKLRWDLTVVGVGDGMAGSQRRAAELDLLSRIHFVGQVDNVPELMRASDIFILPSLAEGMSNALLEAMSVGLACVATSIGGNTELIKDGDTGLLIRAGDSTSLSQTLLTLFRSRALRRRLGAAARRSIIDRYAIGVVADRYQKEYMTMLEESKRRPT